MRWLAVTVLLATLATTTACRDSGLDRYQVSGNVTIDGKPVPGGEVTFEVDRTQGNQGPRTIAKIEQGRYTTPYDKGVVGGPYNVFVFATDGEPRGETLPLGKPLLKTPYQFQVEFPNEDTEQDIDVPSKNR